MYSLDAVRYVCVYTYCSQYGDNGQTKEIKTGTPLCAKEILPHAVLSMPAIGLPVLA